MPQRASPHYILHFGLAATAAEPMVGGGAWMDCTGGVTERLVVLLAMVQEGRVAVLERRQLNYNILKQNVLDEPVSDPLPEPRVTTVTERHKIVRQSKTYKLTTQPRQKDYKLVFNKRVLDTATLVSYPYGYLR